jgi:HPt (histidine-containing phosphotransfer) domain-containing protein
VPRPLDPAVIGELRELMAEDFAALIDAFLADSQLQLGAIAEAAASGDADRVRREAHSLKGACVNLGANDLAQLCGRTEALGRSGDCAAARTMLPALRFELDAVRAALEQVRG